VGLHSSLSLSTPCPLPQWTVSSARSGTVSKVGPDMWKELNGLFLNK
jgi:hypothetical protein